MMKSNNTEPSLNSKALWALFGGGFLGAAIFVLFWKQSLGLNILLSTVIWFVFVQITKIITQKRFYSSKWDLLFIPFFIIGIGTFINDSRSMNAISIVLLILNLPFISILSLYPETIKRFSYVNSTLLTFQQWISSFVSIPSFLKGVFKTKPTKIITPVSVKILIGLVIALPTMCLFTVLLLSADLAFVEILESSISSLNSFVKEVFNLAGGWDIIILFMSFLGGIFASLAYVFAKFKISLSEFLYEQKDNGLDLIISNVVVSGINLVFVVFVIVQFAYLFFGGDRIEDLGLTYSEYARKGFGELQAVAIMAFFVLYSLVRFGRKSSRKLQSVMNGNLLVLLCNTLIIVVSGLVRMNVYIDVFGLSLLRLYSTVFMVFQLLLFVYLIPSLFSRNVFRQFSLISYVLFFAIVSTLALTSPERIVAKENIARSFQGLTLDHNYLMTLSSDGWMPLLMEDSVEITPIHVCHLLSESKETIEGKSWQDQTLKKTQALHYLEKLTHEYLDKNDSSATTNDLLRDECSSILMDEFDSAIEGYTSALVEKKYDKAFTEFWYPGYEPVWSEISEDISISSVSAIDSTKNPWKYVTDPFEIVEPGSTYGTSTTFELNVWDSQRGVFNCYEEDLSVELRNGKVYFNYAEVLPLGYGYKGYNGKTAVSERLDRFNNNRVSSYSECDYTYDYLY